MTNVIDIRQYMREKRLMLNKLNLTWEKHHYYFEKYSVSGSRFHAFMARYYVEKALDLETKFAQMGYTL